MPHVRTQIRDAAAGVLAGLATTGARVFKGRTRPLAKDHEPSLLIYATEERSAVDSMGADPIIARELALVVEGRALADESAALEDTLDQIALEVEPKLQDAAIFALAREVMLTATRITVQSPGERHAGEVRMEFRVVYRTRESAPGTAV